MEEQADINGAQLKLTAEIISAYVSNNPVPASELTGLIEGVHKSLLSLMQSKTETPAELLTPAVPIKKSIQENYLVCLEDGKKLKSIRRHIMSRYGLTPDEYRAKWGLPGDYPMTAPGYSMLRSALAKKMGLGRKPAVQPEPATATVKRGRKSIAA